MSIATCMRVLRLGNSNDTIPGIAEEERAWYVAAKALEAEVGEPVETVVKMIAPRPTMPDQIEAWIQECQPDLVFLKVSWYWYTYESVPLRIQRLLGRAGNPIADVAVRAGKHPRWSRYRWFKLSRRLAHRIIGGDTPYDTQDIVELTKACIRQVRAHESVVLSVKGTGSGRENEEALAGYYHRFLQRRDEVEGTLEAYCQAQGIAWNSATKKTREQRGLAGGDGLHKDATGQYWMGVQEGLAMVEAWRLAHGPEVETLAAG